MSLSTKHQKGQGLVEYALILALVSVVVLGVLLILGPGVGNVFTEINSTLTTNSGSAFVPTAVPPTATPVPTWTFCATEDDFCSFSGTAPVRYGANGTWVTGTYTNGVACTNGVFGDPVPMVVKSCQVFQ